MKRAYKRADGLKLDGRRILVDVERGRCASSCRLQFPRDAALPLPRSARTRLQHRILNLPMPRRTVRGWLPRRLGGGLGDTRRAKPTKRSVKEATWVKPPIGECNCGCGGRLECVLKRGADIAPYVAALVPQAPGLCSLPSRRRQQLRVPPRAAASLRMTSLCETLARHQLAQWPRRAAPTAAVATGTARTRRRRELEAAAAAGGGESESIRGCATHGST